MDGEGGAIGGNGGGEGGGAWVGTQEGVGDIVGVRLRSIEGVHGCVSAKKTCRCA